MIDVPLFVVIGGPEIHAAYVRRLRKAEAAGRLRFGEIVVVDRDPACAASRETGEKVRLDVATWADWLARHLSRLDPAAHVVPYHWAPHVLLDWLRHDLATRGVRLERTDPGARPARFPVDRRTGDGDRALSYATWICPPSCIEPALCPHTRGEKTWSLASELAAADAFVFPCLHLVWGVGTIPVSTIFAVRDRLERAAAAGAREAEIATASHCHGLAAATRIRIGPAA